MRIAETDEIVLKGIGVSPGIAVGPIVLDSDVFEEPVDGECEDPDAEWQRFTEGVETTRRQLIAIRDKVAVEAGTDDAFIFDAHLLMLEDSTLLRQVEEGIRTRRKPADLAFWKVMSRFMESMRRMDDEYLRERVADLEDVARRVVRVLRGDIAASEQTHQHILVAMEISPSETASMDRALVRGFASECGSHTSHSTIVARSMSIPAVVGLPEITHLCHPGQMALLDGYRGMLILNPSSETMAEYAAVRKKKAALDHLLHEMADLPAITPDGQSFILAANLEFARETEHIAREGAQGVGLYRTEFLYLNRRDLPSEDEQAADYARVIAGAGPEGAIIRTLDIGGDKLHHLHHGLEESNPFLGWRGIRVSLARPEIFRIQIRAILRASAHGKARILLPMVSCVEEIRAASALISECRDELRAQGIPLGDAVEIGAMIEVPGAAIIADTLSREVDFFSIGTNDLIQYTLAVDRGNELVATLYQPTHPSIVRLLHSIAAAGRKAGIFTGVCGEMAGDNLLTPLMVGIGFEELSMAPGQIPYVKYAIRRLPAERCRTMVQHALAAHDAATIVTLCRDLMAEYCPELIA